MYLLRGNDDLITASFFLTSVLLVAPFPPTLLYPLALLLLLALLIIFSSLRDLQFPVLHALAWVGGIYCSLYLIHTPVHSLAIRLSVWLGQPRAVAACLLTLVPLLAALAYNRTIETWLLRLMQRAAQRLQPS